MRLAIAAHELICRQHVAFGGHRIGNGNDGAIGRDLDAGQACGAARGIARFGNDCEYHLAMKLDLAIGQNGIIAQRRAAVVDARYVPVGENGDDARGSAHRFEIESR